MFFGWTMKKTVKRLLISHEAYTCKQCIIHWFFIVQFVILEVLIKNRYPIGFTIIHVYTTKYISISMFISTKLHNAINNTTIIQSRAKIEYHIQFWMIDTRQKVVWYYLPSLRLVWLSYPLLAIIDDER